MHLLGKLLCRSIALWARWGWGRHAHLGGRWRLARLRESSEFVLAEVQGKSTRLHLGYAYRDKGISPTNTCTGRLTSADGGGSLAADSDARARRWPASSFCAAASSDAGAGAGGEGSARIAGMVSNQSRINFKGCRLQTREGSQ